ncbi:MAG: hypothetical protein ACRCX2_10240 [Paraclostridium sp.]
MRTIKFRAWDEQFKYMNYKVVVGMWGNDVLDDKNYTACSMWIDPKNVDYKCEPHWGLYNKRGLRGNLSLQGRYIQHDLRKSLGGQL